MTPHQASDAARRLKILHVFRAPLGGLFRHVADLVRGQIARGHDVGIICEKVQRSAHAEATLAALEPRLALGLSRVGMPRHLGPGDFLAARHVAEQIRNAEADVVHGHGAKGGAYVRLASVPAGAIRVYTLHGGSAHYGPFSPLGIVYLTLEKLLLPRTDLFLFESKFIAEAFRRKVGEPRGIARVVHNGVSEDEFAPLPMREDRYDILFIGELRAIKGIDVLLNALASLRRDGISLRTLLVGSGPSRAALQELASRVGLSDFVTLHDPMPARDAFALARLMVVPSRAESLPYIVLEGAAAGLPIVATRVGGIPEIFGALAGQLLPSEDAAAMAAALRKAVNDPESMTRDANALRAYVRAHFSIAAMVDGALAAYCETLEKKRFI